MLDCADIQATLARFQSCEQTDQGARLATQCLYPSFERVHVFVVGHGEGFIVHDGGGAAQAAWCHGAERNAFSRSSAASARSFGCEYEREQIRATADSADWLWAAIASVANASADAARAAVGKIRVSYEVGLIERTKSVLDTAPWRPRTKREVKHIGRSGKLHEFDLGVEYGDALALIDAIVPHHTSIASKFLAFSDTEARPGLYKYAVYDSNLAREDKVLIGNVADLVPYERIVRTYGRFLIQ